MDTFWRAVFLQKLKMFILFEPKDLPLGIYPKEMI